ncbi:MAG: hypothetical protein H6581_26035 [Bacteroidia bacterium]|nr:hypothetical protein [Bacteroidia bacterium]
MSAIKLLKHLFIVLFLLTLFGQSLKGQPIESELEKVCFDEAEFIFEGSVLQKEFFRGSDGGIYTSYVMDIKHVYRGAIKPGTVEVVIPGGTIGNEINEISNQVEPQNGVLFGYSGHTGQSYSRKVDNDPRISLYHVIGFSDGFSPPAAGFGMKFNSWDELDSWISNHKNVVLPPTRSKAQTIEPKKKSCKYFLRRRKN